MWSIKSQIQSMPGDISNEDRLPDYPTIFQAVHWAATDSAGALQAGLQGDLPWAQHGGGARTWWALSFCGGCLHEGSVIIMLLCFFSVYFSIIKSIVMKMIWNKFLRRIIDLWLEEKIIKFTKTTNENVTALHILSTTRFPWLGGKLVKYESFLRECLSCSCITWGLTFVVFLSHFSLGFNFKHVVKISWDDLGGP